MPNSFLQDLARIPRQIEEAGGRFSVFTRRQPRPTLEERLARIVERMKAKQAEVEATRAPRFLGVEDLRFETPTEPDTAVAEKVVSPSPTAIPTPAPGELGGPAKITRRGPVYLESGGKTYLLEEGKRIDVTPPKRITSFGVGTEAAYIKPELFDELMKIEDENTRMALAELAGQESSYGYAGPHISDVEESYGPYHINLRAGRRNPRTGRPFTRKEAEDVKLATQYALSEYLRTGGLGSWNPGAYPFYQEELPRRAKTKKFIRGR